MFKANNVSKLLDRELHDKPIADRMFCEPEQMGALGVILLRKMASDVARDVLVNAIETYGPNKGHKFLEYIAEKGYNVVKGTKGGIAALDKKGKRLSETQVKKLQSDFDKSYVNSLERFVKASEYGILRYNELQAKLSRTGLQAHHLIEKRYAGILGVNERQMKSIALTKNRTSGIHKCMA